MRKNLVEHRKPSGTMCLPCGRSILSDSLLLGKRNRNTPRETTLLKARRKTRALWCVLREGAGKAGRLGKTHKRFILMFQPFGRWEGGGGVKNPTFLKVWSLVSSDTPTIETSA